MADVRGSSAVLEEGMRTPNLISLSEGIVGEI